jgi:hypothetical protein
MSQDSRSMGPRFEHRTSEIQGSNWSLNLDVWCDLLSESFNCGDCTEPSLLWQRVRDLTARCSEINTHLRARKLRHSEQRRGYSTSDSCIFAKQAHN